MDFKIELESNRYQALLDTDSQQRWEKNLFDIKGLRDSAVRTSFLPPLVTPYSKYQVH